MARPFNKVEKVGGRFSVLGGAPSNPMKMTATRLSGVLGYDEWNTPFMRWCEIMRVAKEPFTENEYTLTGKVAEERLHDYCLERISPNLVRPEEVFPGAQKTVFDFYPDEPVFGGMWDDLITNRKGEKIGVVEYKTTKVSNAYKWDGTCPSNYMLQALCYGYLEGVDLVYLVVGFLEEDDYVFPAQVAGEKDPIAAADSLCTFEASDENVRIFKLRVSDGFEGRSIKDWFEIAADWWNTHVCENLSPEFDEKKDKKFIDIIRSSMLELPDTLEELSLKVAKLDDKLAALKEKHGISKLEDELKELKDKALKEQLKEAMEEGSEIIETEHWVYKKSKDSVDIDKAKLKEDGLYDQYTKVKPGLFRLTRKKVEEME